MGDDESDGFGPALDGTDYDDLPELHFDSDDEQPELSSRQAPVRQSASRSSHRILDDVIQRAVQEATRTKLVRPWDSFFSNKMPSIVSGIAPALVLPKVFRSDFYMSVTPIVPAQTAMRLESGSLMRAAVARIQVVPWPQQCVANRARALQRWRLVLEENLSASELGRQLHELAVSMAPDEKLTELVNDTFADRKSSTLNKRAGPVLKYLVWHRAQYGTPGLPLKESRCYEYIKSIQAGPATSGESFLSALRFAHFVVKLEGAQSIFESARIKGVAHLMYQKKRPLKQRRPLKVSEVRSLENLARFADHAWDRYFACFLLLLIFLRARFNDVARQKQVVTDFHKSNGGYFEVQVLDSKTQRSAESKTTFLPLVGPALGIAGCHWGVRLMQERKEQGLEDYCLMPTPSLSGGWIDAPLELASANRWIRDLLKLSGSFADLDSVGSHSCKATALSWCAKAGIDLISRSLLGYHSVKQFGTVLVYSRDALAHPLRLFDEVLDSIRSKSFLPDSTRSGRFDKKQKVAVADPYGAEAADQVVVEDWQVSEQVPRSAAEPAPCQVDSEGEDSAADASSSEASSSGSSDSDGSMDAKAFDVLAKVRPSFPADHDNKVAFYHATSCILHYKISTDVKLKCGRALTDNLVRVSWEKSRGLIRCMRCFHVSVK